MSHRRSVLALVVALGCAGGAAAVAVAAPTSAGWMGLGSQPAGAPAREPGEVLWTYPHFDPSQPVLEGGTLFVPTAAAGFTALSAATGERLWRFEALARYRSVTTDVRPVVSDGLVFQVARYEDAGESQPGRSGYRWALFAVDAATHLERWRRPLAGEYVSSPPALHGSTVYVVDGAGLLLAADKATGVVRWQRQLGPPSRVAPVADERCVTVLDALGLLHRCDAKTGGPLPGVQVPCGRSLHEGSMQAAGSSLVAAGGTGVVAVAAASGKTVWSQSLPGWARLDVTPDGAGLVVTAGPDGFTSGGEPWTVRALDVATGQRRWLATLDGRCFGGPAVAGDLVFVGAENALVALDLATGAEVWRWTHNQRILTRPVLGDGVAYVGSVGEMHSGDQALRAVVVPRDVRAARAAATLRPSGSALVGPVLWRSKVPGQGVVTQQPTVLGDELYAVDGAREQLTCLVRSTGAVRWTTGLGLPLSAPPAAAGRALACVGWHAGGCGGSSTGMGFLERATGLPWATFVPSQTIHDEVIGRDGQSFAYSRPARVSPPAASGQLLFVGSNSWGRFADEPQDPEGLPPAVPCVHAFDGATLAERWRTKVEGEVVAAPLAAGDAVYVFTDKHVACSLGAADGTLRWRSQVAAGEQDRAAFLGVWRKLGGGVASERRGSDVTGPAEEYPSGPAPFEMPQGAAWCHVLGATAVVLHQDGRLASLEASSGTTLASVQVTRLPVLSTASDGRSVLVAAMDGALVSLEPRTGAPRWRLEFGAPVAAPLCVVGAVAYASLTDGRLVAVLADTGRELASVRLPTWVPSSVLVAEGTVFFGTTDGHLYAARLMAPDR